MEAHVEIEKSMFNQLMEDQLRLNFIKEALEEETSDFGSYVLLRKFAGVKAKEE